MLGDAPLSAPWGRRSSSPARPQRVWQVKRQPSPAKSAERSHCSTWTPTAPTYLRGAPRGVASPTPTTLRETVAARAEGLHRTTADGDEGWFEPFEPAIGLTPQELEERQAERGKLAMLRSQREQAVARENAALQREKRMYARALGKAASSQAIDLLKSERGHLQRSSSAAANGSPSPHVRSRRWDLNEGRASALMASREQQAQQRQMLDHLEASDDPSEEGRWSDGRSEVGAQMAETNGRLEEMKGQLQATSDRLMGEEGRQAQRPHSAASGGGSSVGGPLLGGGASALGMSPSGISMRSCQSAASGLSAGALSQSINAPPTIEKLHRGEPLAAPPPSHELLLDRALERGRAATERRKREAAEARRLKEEQRLRKEHAKMLGGAASGYAIEQLKRIAAQSPSRQQSALSASPADFDDLGGLDAAAAARSAAAKESRDGSKSPVGGADEATDAGSAAAKAAGGTPSGSERHAAFLEEQKKQAARMRASASANISGTRRVSAFGRSIRETPRSSSPTPKPRPLSPRLQAMTERFYSSTTESARRAAEVSSELRSEVRRQSSPGRRPGAQPLVGGPLAASHALAEGLSPAEVYMRLAQGAGLPPGHGPPSAQGGGGTGGVTPRRGDASPRARRGAPARPAPQPEMTVTDAVMLIQRRTRGVLGRRKGLEQRAAHALQRVARRWIARRRRAKARRKGENRTRLYAGTNGPPQAALRGKWAERSVPVSSLPAQRSKAGPPSPRGRPTHQKLYDNASEQQERLRQIKQEQSERDERAHVTTCTFSPAQLTRSKKYENVKPRIDSSWSKPSTRPLSPRGGAAGGKDRKEQQHQQSEAPPPIETPPDVSDEWTTVASTGHR